MNGPAPQPQLHAAPAPATAIVPAADQSVHHRVTTVDRIDDLILATQDPARQAFLVSMRAELIRQDAKAKRDNAALRDQGRNFWFKIVFWLGTTATGFA